jgi:hypothetical protein
MASPQPLPAYGSDRFRMDLLPEERKAYIDAVYCLQSRPPLSDPAHVPGARSRFDDFLAVHINQTQRMHRTVRHMFLALIGY